MKIGDIERILIYYLNTFFYNYISYNLGLTFICWVLRALQYFIITKKNNMEVSIFIVVFIQL